MPGLLSDRSDRVRSLLNGGMGDVSPYFWGSCLSVAAVVDMRGIVGSHAEGGNNNDVGGRCPPGDYGCDPLGLNPSDKDG